MSEPQQVPAVLLLEDGAVFHGKSAGMIGTAARMRSRISAYLCRAASFSATVIRPDAARSSRPNASSD